MPDDAFISITSIIDLHFSPYHAVGFFHHHHSDTPDLLQLHISFNKRASSLTTLLPVLVKYDAGTEKKLSVTKADSMDLSLVFVLLGTWLQQWYCYWWRRRKWGLRRLGLRRRMSASLGCGWIGDRLVECGIFVFALR